MSPRLALTAGLVRRPVRSTERRRRPLRRRWRSAVITASILVLSSLAPASALAEDGPGSISGIVYDPTGVPVADIMVSACAGSCTHVLSGVGGAYSITGLAAGNYRLGITDETGNVPGGYATATGTTVSPAAAALVPVAVGPVPFDIHASAGRRISGTISSTTATTIADVFIAACLTADVPDDDFLPCGVDLTAPDGTYSMNVLPGTYKLSASDFTNVYATGYYSNTGYALPYRLATPLAVTTSDLAGINLALPPGVSIGGAVTDNAGLSVDGIDVAACLTSAVDGCLFASTGLNGSYLVTGLPAGSFYVIFSDPEAQQPTGYYGTGGFVGDSNQALAVATGASGATGIDVKFPVGHLISGVITDAAGKPAAVDVEDCTLKICVPVDATGADGTYRMNVAPGSHFVHASDYSGANLSGYYSAAGLANGPHATSLVVGATDLTGINIRLRRITGGIHPGTSHSGTFVNSTAVTKGAYATARFLLTKPFAGSKLTISRAIKSSSGTWSAYKTVATVVVASNGYAYYSARISGVYRYQASLTDPLVAGVKVVSPPVYARPK